MSDMFERFKRNGEAVGGEEPQDPVVGRALEALDPSVGDPGYWFRFQRTVLTTATAELSRRRRALDMTVSDVVLSWWRMLVPAAAAAAALAGFLAVQQPGGPSPLLVTVEEMVAEGFDDAADAVGGDEVVGVSLASEIY